MTSYDYDAEKAKNALRAIRDEIISSLSECLPISKEGTLSRMSLTKTNTYDSDIIEEIWSEFNIPEKMEQLKLLSQHPLEEEWKPPPAKQVDNAIKGTILLEQKAELQTDIIALKEESAVIQEELKKWLDKLEQQTQDIKELQFN